MALHEVPQWHVDVLVHYKFIELYFHVVNVLFVNFHVFALFDLYEDCWYYSRQNNLGLEIKKVVVGFGQVIRLQALIPKLYVQKNNDEQREPMMIIMTIVT